MSYETNDLSSISTIQPCPQLCINWRCEHCYGCNSSSKVLACFKSSVSNPSANQP
jgi:hypothetical protein